MTGGNQGRMCPVCATTFGRDSDFCPQCGTRVKQDSSNHPASRADVSGEAGEHTGSTQTIGAIERLVKLQKSGAITKREFRRQKKIVLREGGRRLTLSSLPKGAVGVLAMLLILGFGWLLLRSTFQKHTIGGSVTVQNDSLYASTRDGGICTGSDISEGYDDIGPGIDVVVRNKGGAIIATGNLGVGHWVDGDCELPVEINDVPDSEFYSITIGHRGEQNYSRDEMEEMSWELTLSIG